MKGSNKSLRDKQSMWKMGKGVKRRKEYILSKICEYFTSEMQIKISRYQSLPIKLKKF